MQKIIIKNFRAIEYAEIELKKVLVLIGEQATGKSTIAKLIYFFKTIQNSFFVRVYTNGDTDLEKFIWRTFIEFFGLVKNDFEVEFWFDEERKICIKNQENTSSVSIVNIDYNNENLKSIVENINEQKNNLTTDRQQLLMTLGKSLSIAFRKVFNNKSNDNLYTIAGRNVTVSYSNIFEQYINTKIQIFLSENNNQLDFDNTDERLMVNFIQKVNIIKDRFNKNNTFQGLIGYQKDLGVTLEKEEEFERYNLEKLTHKIEKILKGKYQISNNYERLILENGKSIPLSDASSGQQEAIRILQDLFLLILDNRKFLRIIEEPEAHLFPIAQKELIELLALAVNYQPENQLIIATHSPYILTVFNNLLFANRVVEKNPDAKAEVEAIVEEDFWLKAEDFSAYALGRDDDDDLYCRSIVNEKTGMIAQNYLDEVSEILGARFQALFDIYKKSAKSRRR
ncbi:MAG: AAA family ATPase [Saprospiraceae bacterium]